LLQRKAGKLGEGLGQTTDWIVGGGSGTQDFHVKKLLLWKGVPSQRGFTYWSLKVNPGDEPSKYV
jgi:hypothetical protein